MDQIPEQAIFIIVFLIIGAVRWFLENRAGANRPPADELWEDPDLIERASPIVPNRGPGGLGELYEQARKEIQERQSSRTAPELVTKELRQNQAAPPLPPSLPGRNAPAAAKATASRFSKPSVTTPNAYDLKKVRRPVLTAAEQQAIVNFEQMGHQRKAPNESNSRVRKLLSNPQAARDAIILSEILNKPKGA